MNCRLCDAETEGSRGPATGVLRPICSDCAAQEDGAALTCLQAQSHAMDAVFGTIDPTPLATEVLQ